MRSQIHVDSQRPVVALSVGTKMTLGKGAPGAGFQVALKTRGRLFVGKLDRNADGPRPVLNGLSGWASVVPGESAFHVAREAHGMARRIALAAKDVDDALTYRPHARAQRTLRASG